MSEGTRVDVLSDENDARTDFAGVIKKMGAKLAAFTEGADYLTFTIEK